MFLQIEQLLFSVSNQVPLWFFSITSSLVEEIIAPIPSPLAMTITGSMAKIQDVSFYYLLFLTLLGAIGKTVGSVVVYFLADKIEDVFSGIFEKYFGINHEQIESFGNKFNGSYKDYFIMFFLRAVPILPSSLISVGSGVLRVSKRVFIMSTFLGSLVRDFIYIYFGYAGVVVLGEFIKKTGDVESLVQKIVFIIIFATLSFLFFKKNSKKTRV
ncbi:MAG: hypothetical protein AB201_02675 [Parcubacteria bacterium C7867-006]|nr:MAG: hypothetical protein AB201_02675 [Parcubacteria bacterium C7867-006]